VSQPPEIPPPPRLVPEEGAAVRHLPPLSDIWFKRKRLVLAGVVLTLIACWFSLPKLDKPGVTAPTSSRPVSPPVKAASLPNSGMAKSAPERQRLEFEKRKLTAEIERLQGEAEVEQLEAKISMLRSRLEKAKSESENESVDANRLRTRLRISPSIATLPGETQLTPEESILSAERALVAGLLPEPPPSPPLAVPSSIAIETPRNPRKEPSRVELKKIEAELFEAIQRSTELEILKRRSQETADTSEKEIALIEAETMANPLGANSPSLEANTEVAATEMKSAEIPDSGLDPEKWKRLLQMGVIGLGLTLGIAWIAERLDDRLVSSAELIARLGGGKILGEVPVTKRKAGSRHFLLTDYPENHAFSQAFDEVTKTLLEGPRVRECRTYLVTGSIPSEGKSTDAVNVALSLAQRGRTLLIDADLRRMNLHDYFGIENGPGLLEILAQTTTFAECFIQTSHTNLHLLRAGHVPDKPTDLFLTSHLADLLKETRKSYDFIVIDSAPVLVAEDTLALVPAVDGVIFITRGKQTPFRLVAKAIHFLEQRGARILGIIFNHQPGTRMSGKRVR
jgi:capsular exopolysaccharide synthesis family protein